MQITSTFKSIDGEANAFKGAGQPSVFIRLAGCNLRCSYCDTRYSYGQGSEVDLERLVERVTLPHATITGGEPLLQFDGVRELCERLVRLGKTVTVETNGTVRPFPRDSRNVRIVMDCKMPSAGVGSGYMASFRHAVSGLTELDVVKFVVADAEDLVAALEARQLTQRYQRVYSPVWGIMEPGELVDWVLKHDPEGQVGLQLHKVIWPDAGSRER